MTDRLAEIRARLNAATPGPWEWREWSCGDEAITGPDNTGFVVNVDEATPHADADLIAHAPADIAWLLDEVERLRSPMVNLNTQTGEITSE